VRQRDADGAVGPLNGIGQIDPGGRHADGRQERRGAGGEDRPPHSPPPSRTANGGLFAHRPRRGDDGGHVSLRRDLVDRPHVGAAHRVREAGVEVGLIVRRHVQARVG